MTSERTREITVKVLSYNIHHGVGEDGKLDLVRIADVLKQSEAEVIALQEVDNHWSERSEFEDQAKRLAQLLEMNYTFAANLQRPPAEGRTEPRQYGVAILSAFPIVATHHYELPKIHEASEQRGLLEATIRIGETEVNVYTVHLALSSEERLLQNKKIIEIAQGKKEYAIFMGDFNAGPTAMEMRPMFELYGEAFEGQQEAFTFPAIKPNIQGDYIFYTKNLEAIRSEIIVTLASDHLPPFAILQSR
ncbi:endonuclease/exonuclease/phosphatase family protein [Paenibacillus sp. UNC451MF]|uniref:endonuclease/exonuclease/phosphatase family protein n=1 Tax=Paenibacillus sp. UNC451MF TaxID=1449063 RepID=UPI00048FE813|nr:endonuclease/exonuclease/phosphatase family protein [Paenibacillus sp. UNC451MF]